MGKLLFASVKMLYRDRQGLFWALAFPLIFTVVFSLFDFGEGPRLGGRQFSAYDWMLPGFVAIGIMTFATTGVATAITQWRNQRLLKRIVATPLPASRLLAAQVIARLLLTAAQVAVIIGVGLALGAQVVGNLAWLLLIGVAGSVVFINLGVVVAARAATVDAANGMASAITLPLMFLSGVFFPTDTLPTAIESIVKRLPLRPLVDALRGVSLEAHTPLDLGPELALIGAWLLLTFALAAWLFRLDEQRI